MTQPPEDNSGQLPPGPWDEAELHQQLLGLSPVFHWWASHGNQKEEKEEEEKNKKIAGV